MNRLHSFTLIELLIVVAIIAILALIAVPNFLEAQTRSKVSRVLQEHRTMATALEAYAVDYNTYPVREHTSFGNGVIGDTAMRILTTPVSYITTIPVDPFQIRVIVVQGTGYHLYCWERDPFAIETTHPSWAQRSPGPDHEWSWEGSEPWDTPLGPGQHYDPSNGTVSKGDIWRTGGAFARRGVSGW